MQAYLFPGQGAQFPGMGRDLFENSKMARQYFNQANRILGFSITDAMFMGSVEDLKQTEVTQPAIFLHSYILTKLMGKKFKPIKVAGHSLGEITALGTTGVLDFESALYLISKRASAMQDVCMVKNTGMALVVGLYDVIVNDICKQVKGIVVPANYNGLKQVVISGDLNAIEQVKNKIGANGVVIDLPVSGAFHSPFMTPIVEEFKLTLDKLKFKKPTCAIYQNVTARPSDSIDLIKTNLITQLTNPVKWRQTILHMIEDGVTSFTEIGPGGFLSGLVKKIDKNVKFQSISKYSSKLGQ